MHVFVNPQVFVPLEPEGAQVVITHEATHVATVAATSPSPIWLVEGFADYVALRAQHLPLRTTAARIIALVRTAGAPRHLPDEHEFAAGAPHLEARYESAWLACRLLADSAGPGRAGGVLPRRRRRASPVEAALREHFGFGLRGLDRAVADPAGTLAGVSERRWALATFLVATAGFVVVAAWRIPWHPVPGGTPPPVPAESVFTPAQIARANAYTDPARHLAWASLAVSLLVTLVLGFTPLGARLVGRLRGWWWVRVLLAVLLLAVIGRLVTLPFAIVGHHRSLDYGLSNEAGGPGPSTWSRAWCCRW